MQKPISCTVTIHQAIVLEIKNKKLPNRESLALAIEACGLHDSLPRAADLVLHELHNDGNLWLVVTPGEPATMETFRLAAAVDETAKATLDMTHIMATSSALRHVFSSPLVEVGPDVPPEALQELEHLERKGQIGLLRKAGVPSFEPVMERQSA